MYDPISDEDRPGFIRKVYGILAVQLGITAAFAGFCMHMSDHGNNKHFIMFMVNPSLLYSMIFL